MMASPRSSSSSAATSDVRHRPARGALVPRPTAISACVVESASQVRVRLAHPRDRLGRQRGGPPSADAPGRAISAMLLLLAGAVMAAAVLAPAWPSVAKALMPVRRSAATLWRPISARVGTVVDRAARLRPRCGRPSPRRRAVPGRNRQADGRGRGARSPRPPPPCSSRRAPHRHVWHAAGQPRPARPSSTVGRLIAAIARPVAPAIRACPHRRRTPHRRGLARRVSTIRAVLTPPDTSSPRPGASLRAIRAVLTVPGHLIAAGWQALSSATIRIFATAGSVITGIVRPVTSPSRPSSPPPEVSSTPPWRPIRHRLRAAHRSRQPGTPTSGAPLATAAAKVARPSPRSGSSSRPPWRPDLVHPRPGHRERTVTSSPRPGPRSVPGSPRRCHLPGRACSSSSWPSWELRSGSATCGGGGSTESA